MENSRDPDLSQTPPAYRGRFAPTPSGPLHFGSLVAALASYLDARAAGGEWLLRIEDIDPPRCQSEANEQIRQCLAEHGMKADGETLFQSQHSDRYERALEQLQQLGRTYCCQCTRAQIKQQGGHDNQSCRAANLPAGPDTAVRFVSQGYPQIDDLVQTTGGSLDSHSLAQDDGANFFPADPVLKRRDGLYGYPLAVAVDDMAEGYTHIIRGADLLEFTPLQCEIIQTLGGTPPKYGHIPVVTNRDGQKLSKQNHAMPVYGHNARENLLNALAFLGQRLDKASKADSIGALLDSAVLNWKRDRIPRLPCATWPPNSC